MKSKHAVVVSALALLLAALPAPARADTYLSPFVGLTFGGDATERAPVYGASLAILGYSAGLEVEYAQSPDFFGDGSGGADTSVTTLFASFQVGGNPMGQGVKPYVLTGAGLIRTAVSGAGLVEDVDYNDFGLTIGAGVVALFSSRVGLRGDLRYFRRLERQSDNGILPIASNFDFFRATAAASFRF